MAVPIASKRRRLLAALVLAPVLASVLAAPLAAMPEAASEPFAAARTALQRGDGIAAEAELNKAVAAGAPRTEVAAAMGEALLDQGDPVRAREWLGGGGFAPQSAAYGFRMLARLERQSGNLDAAGKALDQALAANPRDPLIWVDIGRLRYAGGEQFQAIDASERALAAGPENVRALQFRAELLQDSDGPLAALPLYEKALEKSPDDPQLLIGYAVTLGEAGRATDMVTVARRLMELRPGHPMGLYIQAVVAARAGNMELARAIMVHVGDRLNAMPAAVLLRGATELEVGNPNAAVALLGDLVRQQPGNWRAQLLFARSLYEAGQYSELFNRFDALAKRPDAPAYLMTVLGRAYEEVGDRAAAAQYLDRAAAAPSAPLQVIAANDPAGSLADGWGDNPGGRGVAAAYLRAQLGAGNNAGAQAVAARLQQLWPGAADALSLRGDVALAVGGGGQAADLYGQSARIRYNDSLLLRWNEALVRAGRGGDGRVLVSRYLLAHPQSRLAARIAAIQVAGAGDWSRSRQLLENLNATSNASDLWLLSDLALVQLRSDDAEASLATAEQAARLHPGSAIGAQARALALVSLGRDLPLAARLIDKARAIAGDNPLLHEAQQRLAGRARQ